MKEPSLNISSLYTYEYTVIIFQLHDSFSLILISHLKERVFNKETVHTDSTLFLYHYQVLQGYAADCLHII